MTDSRTSPRNQYRGHRIYMHTGFVTVRRIGESQLATTPTGTFLSYESAKRGIDRMLDGTTSAPVDRQPRRTRGAKSKASA